MKVRSIGMSLFLTGAFSICAYAAPDFGLAENSLGGFRAIRYENVYTKVPTSGKLVSIKITDSGRTYYICREKNGYAIYHLEIRLMGGVKEKIEQEVKDKSRKWDKVHPDELLFTKRRYQRELNKLLDKYKEAVWVRNQIIVEESSQRPEKAGK
jgi:hypothetical protein